MSSRCPECGHPASGRFCSSCGTPISGSHCGSCGAPLEPGARFCNQCGTPAAEASGGPAGTPGEPEAGATRGGRGEGGSNLGWWVAGAVLVVLIVVVALPVLHREEPPPAAGEPGAGVQGGAPGAMPDISDMTPRQAADRLFNRVMQAHSAGDSASVRQFSPMAIQAYAMVADIDRDGLFHLSLLRRVSGDARGGLETARRILDDAPNHLLALGAAAEAALELGDAEAAREYYSRFLEVYEEERAKGLPEYEAHDSQLPLYLQDARSFLEGGG